MKIVKNSKYKFLISAVMLSGLLFSLPGAGYATGSYGGGYYGGGATFNEAMFSLDITYFSNYTPPSVARPSNMTDSIFVGSDPIAFSTGHALIPLTKNGVTIVDDDSTNNVPGLHVTRKQDYIEVAAYGVNSAKSRENVKADFNFTNATLLRAQGDPLHRYENQGNGTCGVIVGRPVISNPNNDQIRVIGNNSGSLCSSTSTDADIVRIYYKANTFSIACNSDDDCGHNGFVGDTYCSYNNVYKSYKVNVCNNPGTAKSSCSVSMKPIFWYGCDYGQSCSDGRCYGGQDC